MTIHAPALVLNADFMPFYPLSTLNWQDAVKALAKGSLYVVAEYDRVVRSPSVTMRLPSVLALKQYVPAPRYPAFTRFNVFLRDRLRCQYCGEKFASEQLTFDHVIPRSRGGTTTWENIVAACEQCNSRKDNAHAVPLQAPYRPTSIDLLRIQREFPPNYLHESWLDYLYWDQPLEP